LRADVAVLIWHDLNSSKGREGNPSITVIVGSVNHINECSSIYGAFWAAGAWKLLARDNQ
jgi:hypothetical protein